MSTKDLQQINFFNLDWINDVCHWIRHVHDNCIAYWLSCKYWLSLYLPSGIVWWSWSWPPVTPTVTVVWRGQYWGVSLDSLTYPNTGSTDWERNRLPGLMSRSTSCWTWSGFHDLWPLLYKGHLWLSLQ